jgi:hypothetical protein
MFLPVTQRHQRSKLTTTTHLRSIAITQTLILQRVGGLDGQLVSSVQKDTSDQGHRPHRVQPEPNRQLSYGDGDYIGYFDGQAQMGEFEQAMELGCNISWIGYDNEGNQDS